MANLRNRSLKVLGGLMLLAILLAVGFWLSSQRSGQQIAVDSNSAEPGQAASTASSDAPTIEVGLIVSSLNAAQYGYPRQTRMLDEMYDSSFDIYPVIDPGSGDDAGLKEVLDSQFRGQTPIDGGSAEQLERMDVLVVSHSVLMPQAEVDAISTAVSHGDGLLIRMFLGLDQSGLTPQVLHLNGLNSGRYGWLPHNTLACLVVGDHPLLGNLVGMKDLRIQLQPNGIYGQINGQSLINVAPGEKMPGVPAGVVFSPLFVATLGNGTIVNCAFAGARPIPTELDRATSDPFSVRAIKWLAGKAKVGKAAPLASSQPSLLSAPAATSISN